MLPFSGSVSVEYVFCVIKLTGLIETVFTVSLEFNFNDFNDRVLVKILLFGHQIKAYPD